MLLLLLTPFVLRYVVLPRVDAKLNSILPQEAAPLNAALREFHAAAFIADMHADSLLWGRDLTIHNPRGHVDLPRLAAGGIDLQVFGVVTQVPQKSNYRATRGDSDILPSLFLGSWRPPGSWFDPRRRGLVQARELHKLADQGRLTLVTRRADLDAPGLKGLLGLEGMHAFGGDIAALEEFHAAGFRMLGLAHFFDNRVAGSAHGLERYGLTALGRELVPRIEALGMTLDLAHASPAAFDDTLRLASKPVVVSHTGVAGTCPGPRNLNDGQLRAVAANGGVIGIGFWKAAVCEVTLEGIVRAILYAVRVAGIDHVGLGSDFDGTVLTPFDATGLPQLTAALLAAGLSRGEVEKILGANVRRVLAANLPP